MRTALITGVTGQDGSWLAELLVARGYAVHGTCRRSSTPSTARVEPLLAAGRLRLHTADLADASSLRRVVAEVRPDEVYHLAAQSHVGTSWQLPAYTADVVALGTLRLLEAVRLEAPEARYYQASTSEVFGTAPAPQRETTPFAPANPYAAAKLHALHAVRMYRDAYGLHASNGLLFNHESERRGERFVTRKITRAVGRIVAGTQSELRLGDLRPRRDWGYAPDYVDAMWRMLQADTPGDYVVATGRSHSVQDFVARAFAAADLDWQRYVRQDDELRRPLDLDELRGDPTLAAERLGWRATTPFDTMIERMVAHDIALARREAA